MKSETAFTPAIPNSMKTSRQLLPTNAFAMNIIRTKLYFQIPTVLILAAMLALAQLAGAAPTWNNATGGNWSVGGNWSPVGAPGAASDVIFGNTGAGAQNTDDMVGVTIDSLTYDWNNQSQQTTVIPPGQTLTVSSSLAAGNALLLEGSATAAPGANTLAPAAITGGGNLALSGAGDIVVHIGNATAGAHMATLDLSGLANLTANVGRLLIGQANGGATVNRPSGTLILAATNTITLTGASPQVILQDGGSNANGGTASVLTFGQVNFLNGDTMRLGGQKGNASMGFGSFSSPSLTIRNADGVSPCTVIDFGYNAAVTTGNSTVMTADFSPGTVDISANLVHIAQGGVGPGTGTCAGTLTVGAGILNVGTFEIGFANATTTSGTTTGTLNLNNNGSFPSGGALLQVSTMLRLAHTNSPAGGTVTGTLNVNGGTVEANSIVSGGGVSIINLSSGSTLIVSNTAGSLTAPIGTFFMSSSTLNVPVSSAGAAVSVKSLTGDGSSSVINISKISPIGAYPATLPIIHYQTEANESFTLGSLPPGGYNGTIVDAGGGTVSLNLTAGPIADLTETWSGANSSDWDTSTFNWLFHSVPTNYFDTAVVIFNDTATQSSVSLDQSLFPNSITVNNNTLQYTFAGAGNIGGTASLIKSGSQSLTLDNQGGDNNISTVVINGGTLQIGAGDAASGGISSVNITNNGALVVDRTDNVTLSSDITGTGTLSQIGGGTLTLSGANTYNGATLLTSGTLEIDQTSSGTGPVTASAGTVLSGGGVVNGAVTVGGQFNPGFATGPGTFQAGNGLTLSAGSTVSFDLNASNPTLSLNDSVAVTGNLTANNNVINVNFAGTPQGTTYTLFTYTGSLSGNFNPVVTGTHFSTTLDTTSSPGSVLLTVTGGSGFALDWSSTSDSTWDTITPNWLNLANSTQSTFSAGDSVLFDDTSGVQTTITIGAGVTVFPSVITDNATNNNFTINGAGHIGGTGNIVKSGGSTLNISTVNSFTGSVDIQGGILQVGNTAALGTTGSASGTTVENGATLDLNGFNIGAEPVTISGSGTSGQGALINNGAAISPQAIGMIILAADATIGGTGSWAQNNSGVTASLSTGGNPFNLTKVGANTITLQNLTTVDTALANIDVQQGTLAFNGITPNMGNPAATNIIEAGAIESFSQDSVLWNKNFVFNGDGSTTTIVNGTSATTELDGPVVLNGSVVFNIGGTSFTITNTISGAGGLIKIGGTAMVLTGPTTYTGDTIISNAALRLAGGADLSGSTNLTINAGATLTVTGMVSSTFPLLNGHTLKGNGVISGALIANAGSTVSPAVTPGVSPVGTLTVSNAIALSGTTVIQLDPANHTNDVLKSGLSTITYGGTLSLTNLSTLTNGSSFKIFSALNPSSYLGSFTSITPATPGPGQAWNISALNTSGTITVVSTATTPVKFNSIAIVSGNVVLGGSNGVPNNHYIVTTSTNLALKFSSWTPIATNTFDANGKFSFTNSLTPPVPQQFYLLQIPGN
jgi:fibronectin-binding autotransporter adhesin